MPLLRSPREFELQTSSTGAKGQQAIERLRLVFNRPQAAGSAESQESPSPHLAALPIPATDIKESDALERALAESRTILTLGDDWDGEGARPFLEATWLRAAAFLRDQASQALKFGIRLPIPSIGAGPGDGSIDLLWRVEGFDLLANVPEDPLAPVTFYGDDRGDEIARGAIPPGKTRALVLWLVRTR